MSSEITVITIPGHFTPSHVALSADIGPLCYLDSTGFTLTLNMEDVGTPPILMKTKA